MPVYEAGQPQQEHRLKRDYRHHPFNAMVARSVSKQETLATPEAMKAMDGEFNGLSRAGVWDLNSVREFDDVAAEARRNNFKVHFGRVFGICGEKGSELPPGSPGRKWKGRFVFQGNYVRDEYSNHAIFDELSSSPATLEASKAVDAYGIMPGHACEQRDAEKA